MTTLSRQLVAVVLSLVALALGQVATAAASSKPLSAREASWLGLYASPSEVAGYSTMVLSIEPGYERGLRHRRLFYSDAGLVNAINQPEQYGDLLTDGDKLYVATASGRYEKRHQAVISGDLERYTRLRIRGRTVLLRDDALAAYRRQGRLYDYGILIQVSGSIRTIPSLEDIEHPSIKILYLHPGRRWRDPFVHGANPR